MIDSYINEFTVFADINEDKRIDTSCLRLLCSYNYLCIVFGDIYISASEGRGYEYLDGSSYGYIDIFNKGKGDALGIGSSGIGGSVPDNYGEFIGEGSGLGWGI